MTSLSLSQLRVLDAIVAEGTLQGAAARLHRTHPTVHTTLTNLEQAIGFELFDRQGYRLALTDRGHAFLQQARRVLDEMSALQDFAHHMAAGEESELRVVVGDLSPLPAMLGLLRDFFAAHPQTKLHLQFEALSAPWQLLDDEAADLALHHVLPGDTRFETVPIGRVSLVPVVAPGYLPFPIEKANPERMRDLVQCVIRDSALTPDPRSYFVLDGARQCSVSDQMMKREVILQGLGWGHMPDYLVADDLAQGRLLSFANRHFKGSSVDLMAVRKRRRHHGPIACRLWDAISALPMNASSPRKPRQGAKR